MPIDILNRRKLAGSGAAEVHAKHLLDKVDELVVQLNNVEELSITLDVKPEFTANTAVKTSVSIPQALTCYLAGASLASYTLPALGAGAIDFEVKRASDDVAMLEAAFSYAAGVAKTSNFFVLQTTAVTNRNLASGDSCYIEITSDNVGHALPVELRITLTFALGTLS